MPQIKNNNNNNNNSQIRKKIKQEKQLNQLSLKILFNLKSGQDFLFEFLKETNIATRK